MKRKAKVMFLPLLLAVVLVCGCGGAKVECDFCGEVKKCKPASMLGERVNICDDCAKDLGLSGGKGSSTSKNDTSSKDDKPSKNDTSSNKDITTTPEIDEPDDQTPTQPFDPFENIEVTFSGIAPDGSISILDKNELFGLLFQPSKDSGLANGDVVEVTLGTSMGDDVYKYCAQYGYKPSQIKKSYTVSGLNHYAEKLADIPNDTIEAMVQQVKDGFISHVATVWDDGGGALKGMNYAGAYYLIPKTGAMVDVKNYLYLVFTMDCSFPEYEGGENLKYYYYVCYKNIALDESGKCITDIFTYGVPTAEWSREYSWSDIEFKGEGFVLNELNGSYMLGFEGYLELEGFKRVHINPRMDRYKYETTME